MTTTHSYGTGVYQMLAYVSRYSLWSPPNSAPIVQRSEELTGLVRPSLGIVVFALLASSLFSLLSALHFQQFKRDFICCFSFKELLVIAEKKKST